MKGKGRKDIFILRLLSDKDNVSGADAKDPAADCGHEFQCVACKCQQVDVVLQPCHHLCVCHNCSPKVVDCPVCRKPVHDKVKVHIP